MDKENKFIDWLCGEGKFPFFQEDPPHIEEIVQPSKLQRELAKTDPVKLTGNQIKKLENYFWGHLAKNNDDETGLNYWFDQIAGGDVEIPKGVLN